MPRPDYFSRRLILILPPAPCPPMLSATAPCPRAVGLPRLEIRTATMPSCLAGRQQALTLCLPTRMRSVPRDRMPRSVPQFTGVQRAGPILPATEAELGGDLIGG